MLPSKPLKPIATPPPLQGFILDVSSRTALCAICYLHWRVYRVRRTDKGSLHINAPVSVVFGSFRSGKAIELWLPPNGMTGKMLAFDFREGGLYHMRLTYKGISHPQGKTSHNTDEIQARFVRLV